MKGHPLPPAVLARSRAALIASMQGNLDSALAITNQIAADFPSYLGMVLLTWVDTTATALGIPEGHKMLITGVIMDTKCDDPTHGHYAAGTVLHRDEDETPQPVKDALAYFEARCAMDQEALMKVVLGMTESDEMKAFVAALLDICGGMLRHGVVPGRPEDQGACSTPGCLVPTMPGQVTCGICAGKLTTTSVSLRNARPANPGVN